MRAATAHESDAKCCRCNCRAYVGNRLQLSVPDSATNDADVPYSLGPMCRWSKQDP